MKIMGCFIGDIRGFWFGGFEFVCLTRQGTSSWQLVVFVQIFGVSHKSLFLKCQAHRLNVWSYICLHEWLISMVDAGIYTIHASYGKSIPGVWGMFVVSKCLSNLDTWILFVVLCQAAAGVAVESSPVFPANFTRTQIRRIFRGLALITTPQWSCVWFASPNSSVIWRKKWR